MTSATQRPPSRILEPSPIREALKLCAVHMRYALFFSALVNLAYLAPTLYMLGVYDMVVPSGSELTLLFVTGALTLTLLTLTYLDRIRARILSAASVRLDTVFSARIFRRAMLNADGGMQPRVNQTIRDFDMIRAAVTGPAALAMFDAPWIPIYVAVCFYLHPAIGGLALGGSVLLFCLAVWNERSTHHFSDRALKASTASFAAQDAAGGSADVVRALGMTEAFVNQFETARTKANLPQMEAAYATGRIGGLIRFLRLFLQSSALGLGAWLAIHKQISGGAIFASSMLAARALSPIDQIVAQWRTVAQALSAYGAIRSHVGADEQVKPTALPAPAASLTLTQVTVATPTRGSHERFDVFVSMGNEVLPPVAGIGRLNVFHCQFPFPLEADQLGERWRTLASYDGVVVNSEFTAEHYRLALRGLGMEAPRIVVVPPPVPQMGLADATDEPSEGLRILSVGRFSPNGHCKRQDLMVQAFARLAERAPSSIALHLAGTVGSGRDGRRYLHDLMERARGLPVYFHPNAGAARIATLYRSASLYWHLTGAGQDVRLSPELFEHFGISIVEAMSAGVAPVALGYGGPAEIIRDGVDGALLADATELAQRSEDLLSRPTQLLRMGRAAKRRAADFSPERFGRALAEALSSFGPAIPLALVDAAE